MRIQFTASLMVALISGCAFAQDWNVSVKTDTNGVLRVPLAAPFAASNNLATVTAVNASNAVQDAALVVVSNAMVAAVTNASKANSNYTDTVFSGISTNYLTNGVGSGCTVTTTGKTFYVTVVAPTGTAASVDADLQDHKTNAIAHTNIFASFALTSTPIIINGETQTIGRANFSVAGMTTQQVYDLSGAVVASSNLATISQVTTSLDLTANTSITDTVAKAASALQAESDTLQTVVNRGNGATNVGSLANISDISSAGLTGPFRSVFGRGLNVTNIHTGAHGAKQIGYNNFGSWTIGDISYGAIQNAYNAGTMWIKTGAYGAQQSGNNSGLMVIENSAHSAQQHGQVANGAAATNNGVGAIQLLNLSNGQKAYTTSGGSGSLMLGAGVSTNKYSIVAGDGQISHGEESITAGGGFYHGVVPVLTNVSTDAIVAAGGLLTNSTGLGLTGVWHTNDIVPFDVYTNGYDTTPLTVSALAFKEGVGMSRTWQTIDTNGVIIGEATSGWDTNFLNITTNGGLQFVANAYVTQTNGFAGQSVPSADWVRSLFSGGSLLYNVTNQNPINTNWYMAANFTNDAGQVRTYNAVTNDQYLGFGIMSTQRYTTVYSPMTVNAYLGFNTGGGRSVSVKPEFYYSYDGTNILGDYAATAQALSAGSNMYSWVISYPTVVSTNSEGIYVHRRFKVTSQTANPNVSIYGSGSTPSTIGFANPPVYDSSLGVRGAIGGSVNGATGSYDSVTRFLTLTAPSGGGAGVFTNWIDASSIGVGDESIFPTYQNRTNANGSMRFIGWDKTVINSWAGPFIIVPAAAAINTHWLGYHSTTGSTALIVRWRDGLNAWTTATSTPVQATGTLTNLDLLTFSITNAAPVGRPIEVEISTSSTNLGTAAGYHYLKAWGWTP